MTEEKPYSSFYLNVVTTKTKAELITMLEDGPVWDRPYTKYCLNDEQKADVRRCMMEVFSKFEQDIEYTSESEDGTKRKRRKFADCIHPHECCVGIDRDSAYCLNCLKRIKKILVQF